MSVTLDSTFRTLLVLVYLIWFPCPLSSSSSKTFPRCPSPSQSYPCFCSKTSLESPLDVFCRSGNSATISLPLKEFFAKDSLPVRQLDIKFANFSHVSNLLFAGLQDLSLVSIEDSHVRTVSHDAFNSFNSSLRSLSLKSNLLDSVPTDSLVALNLTSLDISNNSIPHLSSSSFPKLLSLISLNVSHNNITRMDSSSLSPFSSALEELDLSYNHLKKLERNTFRGFKKIKALDLSFNHLDSFDRNDFSEMLSLSTLKLSGQTSLSKLPQSVFSRTSQLTSLDISYNSFKEVDAYIMRGVRFLRKFIASNNLITSVAKRAFSTNTRLRVIDLSHNHLTSLSTEMFANLQYLESLDLSFNQIKTIEPGSFQSIFKIDINLSHNNLSFIPRHAFVEVANITSLDMSYNNLSVFHAEAFLDSDVMQLHLSHNKLTNLTLLPIGNFTGIRLLNVSHNEITSVTRKSFGLRHNVKLYEMSVVDLSHNSLREVSGTVFERFWALRYLNMSHNHLKRLGFGSFGNLPTLLHVDLSHNQLRDVGGSIAGLSSLKHLDVRHNQLTAIPTLPVALNTLDLENNTIDHVSCSSFPSINSLLSLHLRNNSISTLESDSFCNLITLRYLDMSSNKFASLEDISPALHKLGSLQFLDLSSNSIGNISTSNCLGSLPTLFDVNLSHNGLSYLHPYAFDGLLQLLALNLSSNNLRTIDFDVWKGLVSLQSLDLSYNALTRIENRTNSMFEDLLSLQRLYLSGNRLSFLTSKSLPSSPWVPYKVNYVDLSRNLLESISTSNGFHAVEHLVLSHNHIRVINPGIFGNMSSLKVLDMSHNRISAIPVGSFTPINSSDTSEIQSLNMSYNFLDSIAEQELPKLANLQLLDLSFNRLSSKWPERDISLLVKRGVDVNMTRNQFPCSCESRIKVDSVRRNILRVKPRFAQMLTLNYDVNTFDSEAESRVNTTSLILTSDLTNIAKNIWNSVTCLHPELSDFKVPLSQLGSQDLNCQPSQSALILEGDLAIRGSHWIRGVVPPSLQVVWIVNNEHEDLGNVRIEITDQESWSQSYEVPFSERHFVFRGIDFRKSYQICLKVFDSQGNERPPRKQRTCITSSPKNS